MSKTFAFIFSQLYSIYSATTDKRKKKEKRKEQISKYCKNELSLFIKPIFHNFLSAFFGETYKMGTSLNDFIKKY